MCHHADPSLKSFGVTVARGKSLDAYRAEAQKCVLVCANCHGEIVVDSFRRHHPSAIRRGVGFRFMETRRRRRAELEQFVDEACRRGSVPDETGEPVSLVPHSVEPQLGAAIRDLALARGAERTIEVGLALGMSALFLCQAVLARDGRHVAIDPFQQESWNGAGVRTLREAGVGELVEVIEEESQLALPRLVVEGREFDFAFVDGDHRFEGVFLDLYFMTRLVRPGGLIVVDDMWMPSVRTAVAYVERNLGATLAPDALPNAFRWRRRPLSRGVPSGTGDTAVLRLPGEPQDLRWDEFVPPY
jgi:predicted O-methyltransferase YrrM